MCAVALLKIRGSYSSSHVALLILLQSCRVSQEERLGARKSVASSWVPLSTLRAEGGTVSRTLVVRISYDTALPACQLRCTCPRHACITTVAADTVRHPDDTHGAS